MTSPLIDESFVTSSDHDPTYWRQKPLRCFHIFSFTLHVPVLGTLTDRQMILSISSTRVCLVLILIGLGEAHKSATFAVLLKKKKHHF